MISFKEFLLEHTIRYRMPSVDIEYDEALRYEELQDKEVFGALVAIGVVSYMNKLKGVGNIDTNLANLDKNKVKRVKKQIQNGNIEYPIVGKFGDKYDLISGNTRIAVLRSMGINPKVLVINSSMTM